MKIKNHNKILLHTQLEWLKSKRLATQKVLVKIWANCNSPTSLENSLAVSYKVKYTDNISTILLPGIFPREMKVYVHRNIGMFISVLFTIAQTENNPNIHQLMNT